METNIPMIHQIYVAVLSIACHYNNRKYTLIKSHIILAIKYLFTSQLFYTSSLSKIYLLYVTFCEFTTFLSEEDWASLHSDVVRYLLF